MNKKILNWGSLGVSLVILALSLIILFADIKLFGFGVSINDFKDLMDIDIIAGLYTDYDVIDTTTKIMFTQIIGWTLLALSIILTMTYTAAILEDFGVISTNLQGRKGFHVAAVINAVVMIGFAIAGFVIKGDIMDTYIIDLAKAGVTLA